MRKYDLGKILNGTKKKRAIKCTFTFIPSYGIDFDDKRLLDAYKDQLLHGFNNTIEYLMEGNEYKYRLDVCIWEDSNER